jgi:hypothetical protein
MTINIITIIRKNTKTNCRLLKNLISMSHLVVCCCVPPPTIILAVSFMIMESTKYVALRLIGTVINVAIGGGGDGK